MNRRVQGHIDSGTPGPFYYHLSTCTQSQDFWHEVLSIVRKTSTLRTTLRQRRRSLSARQQHQAATDIGQHLDQLWQYKGARRIAYYLANDGEICPQPSITRLEKRGKQTYLPLLHPLKTNRLYFSPHQKLNPLRRNRFGIGEPPLGKNPLAPIWTLDVILLPLVGFDRRGNRMGMGGGFYDRTLAPLDGSPMKRPLLIGLAHHCQEVEQLQTQSWDIPLDIIATDQKLIHIDSR